MCGGTESEKERNAWPFIKRQETAWNKQNVPGEYWSGTYLEALVAHCILSAMTGGDVASWGHDMGGGHCGCSGLVETKVQC